MNKTPTTEEIASQVIDWSIKRIITGGLDEKDALAIAEEFAEWIEPVGDTMEVFSLDADL
jgi:hypothetical protein